jgi:hypothetical protein
MDSPLAIVSLFKMLPIDVWALVLSRMTEGELEAFKCTNTTTLDIYTFCKALAQSRYKTLVPKIPPAFYRPKFPRTWKFLIIDGKRGMDRTTCYVTMFETMKRIKPKCCSFDPSTVSLQTILQLLCSRMLRSTMPLPLFPILP